MKGTGRRNLKQGMARFRAMLRGRAVAAARILALCIAAAGSLSAGAVAESRFSDKSRLKAAFLFNFARFIEWPDDRLANGLQLCTLGDDPARHAIAALSGKRVQGATVSVRHLAAISGSTDCDMVFFATDEFHMSGRAGVIPSLHGVVTVGNRIEFAREGGVIAFTLKPARQTGLPKQQMGFAINIEAANSVGINFRSNLLKLATVVETTG